LIQLQRTYCGHISPFLYI